MAADSVPAAGDDAWYRLDARLDRAFKEDADKDEDDDEEDGAADPVAVELVVMDTGLLVVPLASDCPLNRPSTSISCRCLVETCLWRNRLNENTLMGPIANRGTQKHLELRTENSFGQWFFTCKYVREHGRKVNGVLSTVEHGSGASRLLYLAIHRSNGTTTGNN